MCVSLLIRPPQPTTHEARKSSRPTERERERERERKKKKEPPRNVIIAVDLSFANITCVKGGARKIGQMNSPSGNYCVRNTHLMVMRVDIWLFTSGSARSLGGGGSVPGTVSHSFTSERGLYNVSPDVLDVYQYTHRRLRLFLLQCVSVWLSARMSSFHYPKTRRVMCIGMVLPTCVCSKVISSDVINASRESQRWGQHKNARCAALLLTITDTYRILYSRKQMSGRV